MQPKQQVATEKKRKKYGKKNKLPAAPHYTVLCCHRCIEWKTASDANEKHTHNERTNISRTAK